MSDDELRSLIVCPRCNAAGRFHHADVENNNSGLILLFGGLLPYLLARSSQTDMVICDRCHYVFSEPSRVSRNGALLVVMICGVILVGVLITYLVSAR